MSDTFTVFLSHVISRNTTGIYEMSQESEQVFVRRMTLTANLSPLVIFPLIVVDRKVDDYIYFFLLRLSLYVKVGLSGMLPAMNSCVPPVMYSYA